MQVVSDGKHVRQHRDLGHDEVGRDRRFPRAMPSRYEGLPIVIVEAMLCERTVVATNVAGHSEVIEDGISGFLAHAPTVASVAKALERF
jgi:Glycosyl transferases group 1